MLCPSTKHIGQFLCFSVEKQQTCQEPLVASLLLVVRPGAPSSFLLLVAMPGAPSSVLVTSSKLWAIVPKAGARHFLQLPYHGQALPRSDCKGDDRLGQDKKRLEEGT